MQHGCTIDNHSDKSQATIKLSSSRQASISNSTKQRRRPCHSSQHRDIPTAQSSQIDLVRRVVGYDEACHQQQYSEVLRGGTSDDYAVPGSGKPSQLLSTPYLANEGSYAPAIARPSAFDMFATPGPQSTAEASYPGNLYGQDPTLPAMRSALGPQADGEWTELVDTDFYDIGAVQRAAPSASYLTNNKMEPNTLHPSFAPRTRHDPFEFSSPHSPRCGARLDGRPNPRMAALPSEEDSIWSDMEWPYPSWPVDRRPETDRRQRQSEPSKKRKFAYIVDHRQQSQQLANLPSLHQETPFANVEAIGSENEVTESVWTEDLLSKPLVSGDAFTSQTRYPPLPELGDTADGGMEYPGGDLGDSNEQPAGMFDPLAELFPEEIYTLRSNDFGLNTVEDHPHGYFSGHELQSRPNERMSFPPIQRQIRDTSKDELLIALKTQGLSYKQIKRQGNFHEAESTLRGRYRTLTKRKEERVRKPEWNQEDEKLLLDAVVASLPATVKASLHTRGQDVYNFRSLQNINLSKVSWKGVAEQMHGWGCYRFGNATVKKKFEELMKQT